MTEMEKNAYMKRTCIWLGIIGWTQQVSAPGAFAIRTYYCYFVGSECSSCTLSEVLREEDLRLRRCSKVLLYLVCDGYRRQTQDDVYVVRFYIK